MLKNEALSKKITIKTGEREYVCEPVEGAAPYIDKKTDKYTVEGVTLWPVEPKQPKQP